MFSESIEPDKLYKPKNMDKRRRARDTFCNCNFNQMAKKQKNRRNSKAKCKLVHYIGQPHKGLYFDWVLMLKGATA